MLSGQILDAMITSCENAKTVLRQAAIDPSDRKTLNISMGATVAAELLGRTPEALSKAEARGRLPAPKTATNGRRFYTVEDLIAIREKLGIKMGKLPSERAVVIAVQNFKGGVSKSTTGKHLADYLALRGYRVLVVDCDPQASMSVMFDVNLEALVDETHTLSNFLSPRIDEADLAAKDDPKDRVAEYRYLPRQPGPPGHRVGTDSNHRGGPYRHCRRVPHAENWPGRGPARL